MMTKDTLCPEQMAETEKYARNMVESLFEFTDLMYNRFGFRSGNSNMKDKPERKDQYGFME